MASNTTLKRQRDEAATTVISHLPHYTQYSQAKQQPLRTDDPVFSLLSERFLSSVTRHRGPKQGDPHREAPKLEVLRSVLVRAGSPRPLPA